MPTIERDEWVDFRAGYERASQEEGQRPIQAAIQEGSRVMETHSWATTVGEPIPHPAPQRRVPTIRRVESCDQPTTGISGLAILFYKEKEICQNL